MRSAMMNGPRLLPCIIFISVAWAVIASPTRAQFVCRITSGPGQVAGYSISSYGIWPLRCKRNECIVGAEAWPDSGGASRLVFLSSIDGGHHWSIHDPGFPNASTNGENPKLDQIDSQNCIAAWTDRTSGTGVIIRTSDGGVTWQRMFDTSISGIGDVSFSSGDSGMVLASSGRYITSDAGSTWSRTPNYAFDEWQCHAYGNGRFQILKTNGVMYSTSDNWKSFDSTKQPIVSDRLQQGQYVFYGCSFGKGAVIFVYGLHWNAAHDSAYPYIARTSDAGQHWHSVYDDTTGPKGYIYYSSETDKDTVLAALYGTLNSVLLSTNNGVTWKFDTLFFTDERYRNANMTNGIGLNSAGELVGAFENIGNSDGYYSFLSVGHLPSLDVPGMSVEEKMQVFPDPAIESITIDGARPQTKLVVQDFLGRAVLEGTISIEGNLTLDVHTLPAGLYFVSDGTSREKLVKQ